jgi:HlyD family secretion protein
MRKVEVGQRTPFEAEIKSGIDEGVEVIIHPSNEIADGMRVAVQER